MNKGRNTTFVTLPKIRNKKTNLLTTQKKGTLVKTMLYKKIVIHYL